MVAFSQALVIETISRGRVARNSAVIDRAREAQLFTSVHNEVKISSNVFFFLRSDN